MYTCTTLLINEFVSYKLLSFKNAFWYDSFKLAFRLNCKIRNSVLKGWSENQVMQDILQDKWAWQSYQVIVEIKQFSMPFKCNISRALYSLEIRNFWHISAFRWFESFKKVKPRSDTGLLYYFYVQQHTSVYDTQTSQSYEKCSKIFWRIIYYYSQMKVGYYILFVQIANMLLINLNLDSGFLFKTSFKILEHESFIWLGEQSSYVRNYLKGKLHGSASTTLKTS